MMYSDVQEHSQIFKAKIILAVSSSVMSLFYIKASSISVKKQSLKERHSKKHNAEEKCTVPH